MWNCGKIAACSTAQVMLRPRPRNLKPNKPNMKDLVYLSRAFVEFGPFAKKEILDFQKRGILSSSADYLRDEGSDTSATTRSG